jgi:TPR repeat protein
MSNTSECSNCGKAAKAPTNLKTCGRCKQTHYCDVECQRLHWKKGGHMNVCKHIGTALALHNAPYTTTNPVLVHPTNPVLVHPTNPVLDHPTNPVLDHPTNPVLDHPTNPVLDPVLDDPTNPCPICLTDEDNSGQGIALCKCGQLFCGECSEGILDIRCPMCRHEAANDTLEDGFRHMHALVHSRPTGRYTPYAQLLLANMYASGRGVDRNRRKFMEYFTLAQNHFEAVFDQHDLDRVYHTTHDDIYHAHMDSRCAAGMECASAQHNTGVMYNRGLGVEQDDTKAFRYYKLAAEQRYARSQYNVGQMLQHGTGVGQDDELAVNYYTLAALQGLCAAQGSLGHMYNNGQGVQQDVTRAAELFKLAADQGDIDSQYRMGESYRDGRGVQQDVTLAAKYFKLAADQGDSHSQYEIGVAYTLGRGVGQDDSMAFKYFKLAADQRFNAAVVNIGRMYLYGKGVEQNNTLAYQYFTLAVAL